MNDRSSSLEPLGEPDVDVVSARRTIVTALPLKAPARERLSQLLGARVLDMRDEVERADMVLTPACSPQLIGALKRKYEGARLVVVELDDWDLDIDLGGPVKRLLQAGADAYLLADSLEVLAEKLGTDEHRSRSSGTETALPGELTDGATVDELIMAFLRESIEYSTRLQSEPGD